MAFRFETANERWSWFNEGAGQSPQLVREVGNDPQSGSPIAIYVSRYGPYVQRGSRDSSDFATARLPEGAVFESVDVNSALDLINQTRQRQQETFNNIIERDKTLPPSSMTLDG